MSLSFRRLAVALVVIVAAVGATGVSLAATAAPTPHAPSAVGQKLLQRFYSDIKARDTAALKQLLYIKLFRIQAAKAAPADAAAFIDRLKQARLLTWDLRDVHIDLARGTLVGTYQIKAVWDIGGQHVAIPWSRRLVTARAIGGNGGSGGAGGWVITTLAAFRAGAA